MSTQIIDTRYHARHRQDTEWSWLLFQFVFWMSELLYGVTWKEKSLIPAVIFTTLWPICVVLSIGIVLWW